MQHENVIRTERDEAQEAIDREVHQDHYHTSVQPIQDREVLPEQHAYTTAEVETRNYKHGNEEHVKERLAAEQAQFKNTKTISEVQHTSASLGAVEAEHVHHHVHESIQPVVQKETIQPSVVHTTIPIHEVHQNEPKHHTATQLPAVTMDEFRNQGGRLTGREERTDAFVGEPKTVGGTLGGTGASGTTSLTEGNVLHTRTTGLDKGRASGVAGTGVTTGASGTGSYGVGESTGLIYDRSATPPMRTGGATPSKKHGLMDKLNPLKDTDHDGKAGIMS